MHRAQGVAESKVVEGSGPGKTRRQEAKASKKILPERFQTSVESFESATTGR